MTNLFDEYGRTAEGKKSRLRAAWEQMVIAKRPHMRGIINTVTTDELIEIINKSAETSESIIKHRLQLAMSRLEECLTLQGLEAIKQQFPVLKDNKAFQTACSICENAIKNPTL